MGLIGGSFIGGASVGETPLSLVSSGGSNEIGARMLRVELDLWGRFRVRAWVKGVVRAGLWVGGVGLIASLES